MVKGKKKSNIIDPKERLLLLIENTREYAIIILDLKGRVEDWNNGAKHLLGYSAKEIVGKNFDIFFTPKDKKEHRSEREIKKAQEIGHAEDDNWLVRKDGTRFWASGLTVAILDKIGNQVGFAKIIRDLTDKRDLEQQKEDFIAIASHELRTPITVANLHRHLLKEHLLKHNDQKGLEYFNKISHAMNQLDNLVRDLLNVTKLQTLGASFEKEIFPIEKIVKAVVDEVQDTTQTHKIIIRGNVDCKIEANKPQIEEVITNLLTNAIKYSPQAKKVIVTLKNDNKNVNISIKDYGIGIEKTSLPRVFNRFYRTPKSREKKLPGIGLGLYITKKIIENHKGKINVKSTPGKGSLFTFNLPIYKNV